LLSEHLIKNLINYVNIFSTVQWNTTAAETFYVFLRVLLYSIKAFVPHHISITQRSLGLTHEGSFLIN